MNECGRKRSGLWSTVTAVVVLLPTYVDGYFFLGDRNDLPGEPVTRVFDSKPIALMYWPLGWCECKLKGTEVDLLRYVDFLTEDWHNGIDAEFRP